MKIGQFAKKYGINASAVRYYIDKTLITPKKENGQYIFDDMCIEQMDRIMRYKEYKFSLEEIELLSYYESTTNLKDKAVIDEIVQILHNKDDILRDEIKQLEDIRENLKGEISAYRTKAEDAESGRHLCIPIEALEILYCPVCGSKLALRDADIEAEGISRGMLVCSCGYNAQVASGMIFCLGSSDETPFRAFENIDTVLAITDDFSPVYRNLIEKAHLWMYQQIMAKAKTFRYALAGPFSHNFMLKHMKSMPDDMVYIITDVSVKKLEKMRKYCSETDRKMIFIAGSADKLPVKKGSIDLYMDDFCGTNYTFTYNKDLFGSIGPLIKAGGMVTGQFIDYSAAPKSLENFRLDHEDFDPGMMKIQRIYSAFAAAGIRIDEKNNCGVTTGGRQHFARHVRGEQVSVISYCGIKE